MSDIEKSKKDCLPCEGWKHCNNMEDGKEENQFENQTDFI